MDGRTVVFFDGVCGLCNGLVRFLLRRDVGGELRFAPLQGQVAAAALGKHGLDPRDLDSVIVISGMNTPDERAFVRSGAVLHSLDLLGGVWRVVARTARIIPRPLADILYRAVAKSRYAIFGRFDACPLPPPEWRDRFLE